MISDDITLDKLIHDIDQQIDLLNAIAADNPILSEQLRLLNESRELLLSQALEMNRLSELIDPDILDERLTIIEHQVDGSE
ncbi:MAG: hypothetical protein HOC70_06355 [Gammaproteobacteria bacterium]|jgi:hypothetical protein|nr:hypothetical protein [Gammaproteobacteria bacterium]MBT4492851.1 hypothetical protein [Gammaproteobacteria bacterium]